MGLGSVAAPSADAVPGAAVRGRRVLVGGVGYTNLRDLSAGPLLVERLACLDWPAGVDVEDLSAGAVHVLHALQAAEPYDAMILVAGVRRGDAPGTVRCAPYRPWSPSSCGGWLRVASSSPPIGRHAGSSSRSPARRRVPAASTTSSRR